MVGLEGAGETEGSRIWGMRASWLMITVVLEAGWLLKGTDQSYVLAAVIRRLWSAPERSPRRGCTRPSIPAQNAGLKGRRTVGAEN